MRPLEPLSPQKYVNADILLVFLDERFCNLSHAYARKSYICFLSRNLDACVLSVGVLDVLFESRY